MVDSMVFMKRGFQEEDLIFEEKSSGKNFNALISKWISKLSLQFYNTKISFETRPITQIDRCCRFLCEIDKIEFTTRDSDSWNPSSSNLIGILLRNNIEFSGFSIRWEVAVQSKDESELTSMCHSANVILYGCQILSISNSVKVNYTLLFANLEPEFEINFNIDTIHVMLAPLPIHWIEILASQISIDEEDSSITRNVKMTQSQYESFFPIEDRITSSFKSQNQDSIYYETCSILHNSSITNTYDEVSLDNSDEDDQCNEFQNDSGTCASLANNISMIDDEGKMNTNFKASMSVKCFSMKVLLRNPSNDFDFWDFKGDSVSQTHKYKEWDYLSTKFFGLLKTVDKNPNSMNCIDQFHKESGDIDYLSFLLSNFMCSTLTKKCNENLHRTFLSADNLKISETLYQNLNSRTNEDSLEIIMICPSDSVDNQKKPVDIIIEYNMLKKELTFEISIGKCYFGLDISLQDRIRLLTQNDILDYNLPEKNTYEINKSNNSCFNCSADIEILDLCLDIRVPIVNLNNEMYSKSYWKYRLLHPESLQLRATSCHLVYETVTDDVCKSIGVQDYRSSLKLYTNSILMSFTSSTVENLPIFNIVKDDFKNDPIAVIKFNSRVPYKINDDQSLSSLSEEFFPINFSKKNNYKPYNTKESARHNSNNKSIHTPSDNEKINEYIKNSISNSYFDIDVHASVSMLLINNQNILEVIYHRLAFDLLLWEPNYDKRNNDVIVNCKSKDLCETDDEATTDTSYEEESNAPKFKNNSKSLLKKLTLNMKIDWCRFYLQTLGNHISESVIELQNVTLFTDSDVVQGLIETQSIFITRIEKIRILFCDDPVIDPQSDMQKLLNRKMLLNENYFCVVDEVPEILNTSGHGNRASYMVVLIMDSQLTQLKRSRNNVKLKQKASTMLTAQINRFCLRHNYIYDVNNGFGWLISLTDLLSLNNPVITGYVMPDSDTTMYLHAAHCAIDLCFHHFPMASFIIFNKIELEMIFSVTESYHLNIEFAFIGSQIYIRSNDNLQLATYFCWNNENWLSSSLIDHGYCFIADLGNLDLKFKKIGSTNSSDKEPTCSLEITNTEMGIHLCADSLNLLVNCFSLLFSTSTDLNSEESNFPSRSFSSRRQNSETNINQPNSQMLLNESDKTKFNHMINDAMKDDDKPIQMKKAKDDEFCDGFLLVDDIFSNVYDRVNSLENSPNQKLSVVQDHFKTPSSEDKCIKRKKAIYKDPDGYPISHNSMVVHDFSLSVNFYAGTDLDEKCKVVPNMGHVKSVRSKMCPPVKFSRFKSDKSQIDIQTADFDAYFGEKDKSIIFQGGSNRKINESYQWKFKKMNFRYALFSNMDWLHTINQQVSRRLVFSINEIEILCRHSNSKINMILFCDSNATFWYDPKSPMVSFKMVFVQSNPNHDVVSEECDIKLSVQPIMLNFDQDFVIFIEKFYKDLNTKDLLNTNNFEIKNRRNSSSSALSESPHQEKDSILIPPSKNINKELILGRGGGMDSITGSSPLSRSSTVRLPAFDEMRIKKEEIGTHPPVETSKSLSSIFIRSFSLYPDIYVRLDYTGTRLDFTQGAIKGFLYILIQLNNVILIIKSKQYLEGITGFDVLLQILTKEIYDEFMAQINKILTKVGPISEISEMLSGIYDLFSLPYQYYHNERGLIEGIKLGTRSITTTSLWATLTLLSKGLRVFQKMAETTYDLVSPSSSVHDDESQQLARDLREGVTNAAYGVRRRINNTAHDMQLALQRPDRPMFGRMGDFIRQVPPVFASPIVATCEASNQLIDGLRYQLKPEMKIEDEKKWKH
uniref:Autophagy-related protein 2 n=1 Tax=Dugesia japonica TaxID=6161 RepID=A0A2S1BJG7_DUGJA|nr:Atg2 [Dugesia japonica]